jgi:hypothetical protein
MVEEIMAGRKKKLKQEENEKMGRNMRAQAKHMN